MLKVWDPYLDLYIHQDYGLPSLKDEVLRKSLVILSSYSGNTEEVLEAYNLAGEAKLTMAVVTVGGKLLAAAQQDRIPYIALPNTDIQPRSALGFSFKAFLKLVGAEKEVLQEIGQLASSLDQVISEREGKALAARLKGFVPVTYASSKNLPIAYNWKIKFNETGKIPAFYNILPELNHNEMTGFDVKLSTRALSDKFYFLILKDTTDHPKILTRMEVLAKLYEDRKLKIEMVEMREARIFQKMFSSLLLADWAAYYTGEGYGLETEQVPMVEEFKQLID